MSFKDKIASFLHRPKAEEKVDEELLIEQEASPQEVEAVPEAVSTDPSSLELPADHPIRQLYSLRLKESGSLPSPRLCMDEDGILPKEVVAKELVRLQSSLKNVCGSRLKAIKGRTRGKHNKKKAEAEAAAEEEPLVLDARPWFFLSSDKLYAWMVAFPPVGPGAELTKEMIWQSLSEHSISFGVNTKLVDRIPRARDRYFTLYLVAKGKPAFDGRNGNIVDYFPRAIDRVLEVNEFGQVDYTALNLICNVEEGQEICRLIRPTEGEPGRTVLDQEVPAKSGKSVPLPKGRNTEISEDGDALIAAMPGHVEFTGHNFQVKPVLDIDGNVDFSTGNIKFVGDVNIKGDVLSGFTVRSAGNIQVGGVVEAGSTVEAGGDLVVARGILGDGTTVVQAHRSIFAKYIENSTIYAREVLQTDCIVNGNVYCDGEVQVNSGRGSIMGGRVWAAKLINARAVGSQSECRTSITLGGMPCTNFEREILKQQMKTLEMELERLECQIDSPTKSSLLSKTRMKLSVAGLKLRQLDEEQPAVQLPTENRDKGRMECGIVYPGTEISIGDEVLRLRRISRQCVVTLINDEIVVM
jgi:hypothetical protein